MTRLDALKARLAVVLAEDKEGVAVSPECPYSDAELDLLDHAREDIERLVAVVETAQALTKIPESEMSLGGTARCSRACRALTNSTVVTSPSPRTITSTAGSQARICCAW